MLLVTIILLPTREHTPIVAIAAMLAAIVSYVPLRYWNRIQSSVSRHPLYLALEVLLATLILAAAGARSPFFYFTLGTAAIAGVVYGRRGALPFSVLLIAAYELVALEGLPNSHPLHDAQSVAFVPLLYVAAIAAGIAARELVQRGMETDALLRERTEALASERERTRVARELHDSLAKTVEGLAMTAGVLPARLEQAPAAGLELARQLAVDATDAAREARALMSDLRASPGAIVPFAEAARERAMAFSRRSGIPVDVRSESADAHQLLAPELQHELLQIMSEALINAERHASPSSATIEFRDESAGLTLSVQDDGVGIQEGLDLASLTAEGHYGLAGMHERARAIDGELTVGAAPGGGTVVTVRVPSAPGGTGNDQPRLRHLTPSRLPLSLRWLARGEAVAEHGLQEFRR